MPPANSLKLALEWGLAHSAIRWPGRVGGQRITRGVPQRHWLTQSASKIDLELDDLDRRRNYQLQNQTGPPARHMISLVEALPLKPSLVRTKAPPEIEIEVGSKSFMRIV